MIFLSVQLEKILGPITDETQLRTIVEIPAQQLGITLEPYLTERILQDIRQQEVNLPLLEFALTQLWDKQRDGHLTHTAYGAIGGVTQALSEYADVVYARFKTKAEPEQLRRIFVELVRPGEGTEDTRQIATREQVGNDNWDTLVKQLAEARLIVTGHNEETGQETVEVVHEALIRHWQPLHQWMLEDHQFRVWQNGLRQAIQTWEQTGRDDGALLQGVLLAEAEKKFKEYGGILSLPEQTYIKASIALRQLEPERREQEIIELRESKKMAETANLAKNQFMVGMSHELRTPVNAIFGYSEMLTEEAEDFGQEDFLDLQKIHEDFVLDLQKIQDAGKYVLRLMNDVLDVTKIEDGKMELFIEAVDLDNLINEIVSTVQPLVAKKNNILEIERSDTLGEIQTDITKLRQMLLNLISNAAKFTEKGIIRLSAKRDGEWIIFDVVDNGIGVREEQQQKLFQPFFFIPHYGSTRCGSTGLGLALTKQFAQMMGGTIQVDSKFGVGSTFTLSLPVSVKSLDTESSKSEPEFPEK